MTWDSVPDAPTHDFNEFLHELRTRELRKMPPGGKTVLSGGAAGGWYFKWMKDCYPSLTRHIGVEAYSPRPADLPPEGEWIANYLGNMHDVRTGEVDLVFAGQTVEHMWPDDLANFLCESHRVLAPDGVLVLDSPNRRLTRMLGWYHIQHTAELNVDEIKAMVTAAGFDRVEVRGVWLCYAQEDHAVLPFEPRADVPGWPWRRRVALSEARPEDCFVWWLEARRSGGSPDKARVAGLAQRAYDEAFQGAVAREFARHDVRPEGWGRNRVFRTDVGSPGYVSYGPYVPLRPGRYAVRFGVGRPYGGPDVPPHTVACEFDAVTEYGGKELARRVVTAGELGRGELVEFELPFRLAETGFGCEFRAVTHGAVPLVFRSHKDLVEVDHLAQAFGR